MPLQVGYAQRIITPALKRPVFLAGFDRDRRAESVHDDLYARALALESDGGYLVLVALDLIGLGRADCQDIARKLDGAILVIACTHTHHGPDTLGLWGPNMLTSGIDRAYMDGLKDNILSAAREALSGLRQAELKAASTPVPGVAKNARDPNILDDALTCLQFIDPASGQPLVTLANFPCHPEVLWRENPAITSDYPHFLRAEIERQSGAPCLFFSGALGGMMTPDVEQHSFEEAEEIGLRLAREGLQSLSDCRPQQVDGASFYREEFEIPVKSLLLEQAMRMGLVRATLMKKGSIQTETSLLGLGTAWLAMVPGELLPRLGLELKAQMLAAGAQVCGIIGLANDELGYILPEDDYQYPTNPFDPGDHYEETMSIGPTAAPALFDAFNVVLNETVTARKTIK
jgi:hypothetical protein